ncbi:S66 peptidase family protein [Actinomadura fibrosa]|uniref:LD-carboxypeptidase n=1 Tax=Actinomadura fibrosa TaxID=111802 RepID=A0ABW2Y0R8_9ACTN|nr:LD-carboxypeptidase [Actinomadura fibrosa]
MSGGARAEAADGPSDAPAVGMPGGRARMPGPRRYGALRPGDRVAVVAPSGPVEPERLEAGCAVLRDLGLDVAVGEHALDQVNLGTPERVRTPLGSGSSNSQGSRPTSLRTLPGGGTPDPQGSRPESVRDDWQRLAGSDADRAADLQAAWCDPRVRAVVCARGGYGATRVLDHLDWDALAAATAESAERGGAPKILHGSSDITALHAAFAARLGVTTSFGPMPAGRIADLGPILSGNVPTSDDPDGADTLDGLRAGLFRDGPAAVRGTRALRPGHAEGPLTGGTLTLLTALLGTPYASPPAAGRIVFLEDVAEAPYRIDRMLVQLLQAGYFDGAAGIALGSWERSGDPAELDSVFTARLGPLGVPVLAGVPAGHGPRQRTLELGAPARLDGDALTLSFEPPRASGGPLPDGVLTLEAPGGAR